VDLRKNEDSDQTEKERDLTAEMLEWAKDRIGSAPKTTPGAVEPLDPAKEPAKFKQEPIKLRQGSKLLVVTLNEATTQEGKAHFFDDSQEASRFIETLMESGLDEGRIVVFQGTPMNLSVSYRPVVAIEKPGQDEPVAS
jgi:hypothetical protein